MLVVLAFASKPLNFTGRNYHVPGEVVISSVYSGIVMTAGKDKLVLQWSIEDHITGIQEPYPSRAGTPTAGGGRGSWTTGAGGSDLSDASSIAPRGVFKGHSDTVEDVQFRPSSMQEFCSVGDDSCLVFWDARSGHEPTLKVTQLLSLV
jgi:histone-binding protein RBBP4